MVSSTLAILLLPQPAKSEASSPPLLPASSSALPLQLCPMLPRPLFLPTSSHHRFFSSPLPDAAAAQAPFLGSSWAKLARDAHGALPIWTWLLRPPHRHAARRGLDSTCFGGWCQYSVCDAHAGKLTAGRRRGVVGRASGLRVCWRREGGWVGI